MANNEQLAFDKLNKYFDEHHCHNEAWQTLKATVLAKQTTNSDYAAALFETIVKMSPSYIDNDGETVVSLTKERLNAALKAARHCA